MPPRMAHRASDRLLRAAARPGAPDEDAMELNLAPKALKDAPGEALPAQPAAAETQ